MGRKSKLTKLQEKIFEEIMPELIKLHKKKYGDPQGFIWIENSIGEMICFSDSKKTLKNEVSGMRID